MSFKGQFTSIKDISDRRRLPRLGKIRLGIKKKSTKTGAEYPAETDYFVCPPEVQKLFGEQPKELPIMFPIEDREVVFPQALKYYGQSKGLKCIGNGETAIEFTEEGGKERECPCEKWDPDGKRECQRRAHLMVLIPKISCGGIYQIDIGSYHSIVDLNSGIDWVRALIGRFSRVPLILKREPKETHGGNKRTTHYTLQLEFRGGIDMINLLQEETKRILAGPQYALPMPEDINPKFDNGATIEYTDDEENGQQEVTSQSESEPEPPIEEEKTEPETAKNHSGVFQTLLSQIQKKVTGIKNVGQAEKLVPKEGQLEFSQAISLVNHLATCKGQITLDDWNQKRDEILGK